ncbi:hypothetical protein [Clostridium sp.]|uniref:hypothetical protein n=1 Tax=Clostridium sp. TaxID=1506 RepID=UPI001A4196C0|nr:hypothetical protein [Clostridium sp.]MBK5235176.1 hypothetical protein [Clostridium sp.]
MKLNTLESQMVIDIYDADMLPEMLFEIENYKLTEGEDKRKKQEFAFHLEKLKKLGFIKYEEKEAFLKEGIRSTKYNNNVAMIYENKIHIDSKGINLVEWDNHSNSEILRQAYKCG